ncbi:MAG: hypothetical protein ACLVEJ_19405 [Parabacteroides sp.]
MQLENCCYDFFEILTVNMVQQGLFGEIIHGEGAYIHELLSGMFGEPEWQPGDGMKIIKVGILIRLMGWDRFVGL